MNKYPVYNLAPINYKIITASFLFLVISYILMYLGSKNNIDFLSLTLAPIMQIIGYIAIVYAVLKE